MAARGEIARIVVASAPGIRHRGVIMAGTLRAPCTLGRSGTKSRKVEGDGATPSGTFGLIGVLYRPDRWTKPVTRLSVEAIRKDSGWCDDPADRNYNRPVRLPYLGRHERLWRDDHLYDVVVVIDYNLSPPRPHAGSAIFLHIARENFAPTEGCVAIATEAMRRLLTHCGPDTAIEIR